MRRSILALLLLLAAVAAGLPSAPRVSPAAAPPGEVEPDVCKARPLDRWPSDEDLAKLASVEGQPRRRVLEVLGHPCGVDRRPDGVEVWDYPWVAACRVWIKNGVCTGTFCTGGY
jgi:hypothetical protein